MKPEQKFKLEQLIRNITYNLILVYEQIQEDCNLGKISDSERKTLLDIVNKIAAPLEFEVINVAKLIAHLKDKVDALEAEVSTLKEENSKLKKSKGRG